MKSFIEINDIDNDKMSHCTLITRQRRSNAYNAI